MTYSIDYDNLKSLPNLIEQESSFHHNHKGKTHMEPENIIRGQERRRRLLVAMIACFGLAILAQMGRSCLVDRAETSVTALEQQSLKAAEQDVQNIRNMFTAAKVVHHPQYLKKFEMASLDPLLAEAKAKIEAAHAADHPNDKENLAQEAEQLIARLDKAIGERRQYLVQLNAAKDGYFEKVSLLRSSIFGAKGRVTSLVSRGFFKSHFAAIEELTQRAESRLQETEKLNGVLLGGTAFPDYLKIWQTANDGLRIAEEAGRLIDEVPQRADKNKETLATIRRGIRGTEQLYPRAVAAAEHLTRYPRYACTADVLNAYRAMTNLENQLREAEVLNGMERQKFQEATTLLDNLATVRANSDRTFVLAIDRWRDVETAVAALSEREQTATRSINRASNQISDYSYNNQSDAEDFLRNARVALRDGQALTTTDPLGAKAQFESAESKANKAYDEVDTSPRRTSRRVSHDDTDDVIGIVLGGDDDDDDDDGFFGGGGGGSWGGGSDDDDDSGGGGGWGGSFGGPSGEDFGGPSGGDFGDGDF